MTRRLVLRTLAGVIVSALAVILVARTADIPTALARVVNVDPRWLVLPALVVAAQLWVRAARWAILLRAVQPAPVATRAALWPTAAGYLGNVTLPARMGEVIRIVLVARRTPVTATAATASVLIERAVDLLALLAFAAAAYGVAGAIGWLPLAGMLLLLLALGFLLRSVGWLVPRVPSRLPHPVRDVTVRFLEACRSARLPAVGAAWLVSLAAWLMDAATVFLCAMALGLEIPPSAAVLLSAGGALGAALPAAAAAFGTYELGAVTVATLVGIPADTALQVALLSHVVGVVTIVVIGVAGIVTTSVSAARRPQHSGEPAGAAGGAAPDDRLAMTVVER